MCTQMTLDKIEDVVTEFLGSNRLFTAFEVSLEVQKRQKDNCEAIERHRHMKREIHTLLQAQMAAGLYTCANHVVGTENGQPLYAILYYPVGTDPNSYLPLDRRDSVKHAPLDGISPLAQVAVVQIVPATPSLSLVDNSQSSDGGRKTDARGVICVPSTLLRAAGFQPKDIAYVIVRQEGNGEVVVLTKRPSITPIANYTVDYSNNVRITRATLDAVGIGKDGATYDFEGNSNNEVLVRLHG